MMRADALTRHHQPQDDARARSAMRVRSSREAQRDTRLSPARWRASHFRRE